MAGGRKLRAEIMRVGFDEEGLLSMQHTVIVMPRHHVNTFHAVGIGYIFEEQRRESNNSNHTLIFQSSSMITKSEVNLL